VAGSSKIAREYGFNEPELRETAATRQSKAEHNEPLQRWNLLPQICHAFHEGEASVERAHPAPEDAVAAATAVAEKQQQEPLETGPRPRMNNNSVCHQLEISVGAVHDGAQEGFAGGAHEHRERRRMLDGAQNLQQGQKTREKPEK
jgi:hypothetical protein